MLLYTGAVNLYVANRAQFFSHMISFILHGKEKNHMKVLKPTIKIIEKSSIFVHNMGLFVVGKKGLALP
jgi:hypothetical protein